jgi:hypothetical protein
MIVIIPYAGKWFDVLVIIEAVGCSVVGAVRHGWF